MAFALGALAIVAVLWFLVRLKKKDFADCAAVLGLDPVPPTTSKGSTPEGLAYSQTTVLAGTILAHRAILFERFVRHPAVSKRTRRGSHFTVLELTLDRPSRVPVRLQPTGMLGSLEWFVRGDTTDKVAIETTFDAAYTTYSTSPSAVLVLLTPDLRERILAFRSSVGGHMPATLPGQLASGLVLGTFHIDGTSARYTLFGSPTKATAEHVKAAAPLLVELARRAGT